MEELRYELRFAAVCTGLIDLLVWGVSVLCIGLTLSVPLGLLLGSAGMLANLLLLRRTVQNAVYQAMVDEWGSPLRRLSAYGESPMVADPEIVNAVWDLGAAVTAYRNLGGKPGTPIGKLETGKITPDRFKRIPNNLPEELTLDEATHGAGNRIMENKVLGDPRYSGMEKWQHVHVNPDGTKIVIHFVVDPRTGVRTDFKFK